MTTYVVLGNVWAFDFAPHTTNRPRRSYEGMLAKVIGEAGSDKMVEVIDGTWPANGRQLVVRDGEYTVRRIVHVDSD